MAHFVFAKENTSLKFEFLSLFLDSNPRHCAKIQDYDAAFYSREFITDIHNKLKIVSAIELSDCSSFANLLLSEFHMIVCGLDSIVARRWINGMLVSNCPWLCAMKRKCFIFTRLLSNLNSGSQGGGGRSTHPTLTNSFMQPALDACRSACWNTRTASWIRAP